MNTQSQQALIENRKTIQQQVQARALAGSPLYARLGRYHFGDGVWQNPEKKCAEGTPCNERGHGSITWCGDCNKQF